MNKTWTLPVTIDPETQEAMIEFPPDLMEESGFKPNDTIRWIDNQDGTFSIEKVEE